jgi:imidazolonepropionase
MPQTVDLLIIHARQLITCASHGPKRGAAMADVGIIEDGAVAVQDGQILAVGPSAELLARYAARTTLDAAGKVVTPGFVDAHTHVVYAGDRVAEFEMRIKGATYMEIMAAGGGIVSTMRAVRAATAAQLAAETHARLDEMLALGTTTAEVKTGYGLSVKAELKLLRAIAQLHDDHPMTLIPTFLGAHAVPPEYQGRTDAYVDLVVNEMIPAAASWRASSSFVREKTPFFCDVFCEAGVFDAAQSRRVLEAGRAHGMTPKIHADEFENLGGVALAVALRATSVDHLDVTPKEEFARLAASDTSPPRREFQSGRLSFRRRPRAHRRRRRPGPGPRHQPRLSAHALDAHGHGHRHPLPKAAPRRSAKRQHHQRRLRRRSGPPHRLVAGGQAGGHLDPRHLRLPPSGL